MSYYFREKPTKLRGKSGDELLQQLKQHFDDDKNFDSNLRNIRDPFERHGFSRGFPFDDEDFGRRGSDIRAHLDNLAARHPELAEHLLGPPWGDFNSLNRNRRRGSGSSQHNNHLDEDTRSQASGSSAASAASGASGVSSHSEPEHHSNIYPPHHHNQYHQKDTSNSKIPQYGLRNTVDIGQHRHNIDNSQKMSREQRSMSAPPENRQKQNQPSDDPQSQQSNQTGQPNQRFVSRVDITPQYSPQADEKPSASPSAKPSNKSSNVRHIPIFVEGRDEPVISKNVDEPTSIPTGTFKRQQSPSSGYYQQPQPQYEPTPEFTSFNRSSPFNHHFGGRHRDWPTSHFPDQFYDSFDGPGIRRTHQPSQSSPFSKVQTERQRMPQQEEPQSVPRQGTIPRPSHHHQQQQQQHQQPPVQEQRVPTPPPKQKPVPPKDPLERVALVQQEVDSLTEQVKLWNGNSRKDKQYIYLDEMLTRELIKLDDIETEGKENVRQARKNAIKSIQDSISLLETKAPLSDKVEQVDDQTMELEQSQQEQMNADDVEQKNETKEDDKMPVDNPVQEGEIVLENKSEAVESAAVDELPAEENQMETEKVLPESQTIELDLEPSSEQKEEKKDEVSDETEEKPATVDENVDTTPSKPVKSPKKMRKTKKNTPISKEPIPLPLLANQNVDDQQKT